MNSMNIYAKLLAMGEPAFTTTGVSALMRMLVPAASKALHRMAEASLVTPVARNLWMLGAPGTRDPRTIVPQLLGHYSGYISLYSALRYHGMITQIPTYTYVVSTCRAQKIKTQLGTFSIHHIPPAMLKGYVSKPFPMATPEKAVIDCLYLAPSKTGRFSSLTEVELPKSFNDDKAREWADMIQCPRRRSLVHSRLAQILEESPRVEWTRTTWSPTADHL